MRKFTEEHKKNISLGRMHRKQELGYLNSPETRKKISASLSNQKRTPLSMSTRRKISESQKGKKLSKEHINKLKIAQTGKLKEECSHWKGGKPYHSGGYILIYCPTHPYAINNRYVLEHRLVMEAHIGRILLPTEIVHHINGIRDDNRIENLMLFANIADHRRFHGRGRV